MATTKFSIIVVGAGFGGLACAIALAKEGISIRVFELAKDLTRQGKPKICDVIMIGSNATRIISKWGGGLMEEVWKIAAQPDSLKIQDKNGKLLLEQPLAKDFDGFPNIYTNRTRLQNLLYKHALSLGVQFTFNARVTEYFEEDTAAGLILNGTKHVADVVLVADGVHSKGRAFLTGAPEKAMKSGFAVYRSWFPLDRLSGNELTWQYASADKDQFEIWIAEDTHAVLTTNVKEQTCTCFATHKDLTDIEESWHLKGSVDDMLDVVNGWDPVLRQVIKSIPMDQLIDHKLLWRNPNKRWVSKNSRIALVGDAAHPHLATSGTGGAQAIEDGATLAILIKKTGQHGIKTALQAYECLRYERTSLTQRMGWETRHRWHQTDWEAVAANPEFLKLPQPEWLNGHDAEQYADTQFDKVVEHLSSGSSFKSSNIPEGHVHQDWTIQEMLVRDAQKANASRY
ncbi:hypothetical protein BKA66DRAFT_575559 [Pyrenochaeta sp. MPI-SDFR-AT-0127]|nr:hypothetical protein BKA66DRAFT_575559 [Pyrenochaeta sp. MPI-SDFR-AT-0127]